MQQCDLLLKKRVHYGILNMPKKDDFFVCLITFKNKDGGNFYEINKKSA